MKGLIRLYKAKPPGKLLYGLIKSLPWLALAVAVAFASAVDVADAAFAVVASG